VSADPNSTKSRESDTPAEVAGGFPRHLTRDLLEEETRQEERRLFFAPWFLGAAFVLFSLALPLHRVIGSFPMKAEAGESLWWFLIEGAGGELAGFFLSALAAGLFLPVAAHALMATGLPRASALIAAVCVGLSPLLTHAATLPGPEAVVGLLSILAFWVAAPHGVGSIRTSVGIALGVAAAALDPGGLLILPALLTRHFSRKSPPVRVRMFGWYGVAWAVALGVALEIMSSFLFADIPASKDPSVLRWAIFPGVLGLGLASLAILGLFWDRKQSLSEDAPLWLRLWALGGVCTLLLPGASGICLAPAAAFAIADLLSRGSVISRGSVALLLAGQLCLTLGSMHHVRTRDPNGGWSRQFRLTAEEGDKVVSRDPAHRYLTRIRWGFMTFHADVPLGTLSPPYVLDLGNRPPFIERVVGPNKD